MSYLLIKKTPCAQELFVSSISANAIKTKSDDSHEPADP